MASLPLTPGIPLPFDNLRAQALGPTCAGALGGRLLVGIAVLVLVGVPETFALITGLRFTPNRGGFLFRPLLG